MARIRTPQTAFLVAMRNAFIAAAVVITLGGCAIVVQETKRSVLDQKCQERVVTMLNAVSPVATDAGIPEKFCGCFMSKVDVVKLETDVDGVKDIGLNPETLRFVTEYIPTIRGCARETGLWKGL